MQPEAETGARSIACPACGGTVAIRAAGYTVTLACEYCGSLIDVADPTAKLIQRYEEAQRELDIPLGTRGTLRGVEWEAIGWVLRSDSGVFWEEYLLFNPYHGYRWLVESQEHWSFGTMLTDSPISWLVESQEHWSFGTMLTDSPIYEGDGFSYGRRKFDPFFRDGRATVEAVVGEFYWRVAQGETVTTADYVRPGTMLSMEENDKERSWTLNELLNPDEIVAAFPVPRPPSWRFGTTPPPHMPSPFAKPLRSAFKIGLAAAVMLLAMLILLSGGSGPPQTFSLAAVPDGPTVSRSFGPIVLTAPRQGIRVRTSTPQVDQGWVDIDIAFVDRKTQASFEAYSVNEHYSGSDSDGSWSEGSRGQTVKLASLPAGTYDLMVEATAHSWESGPNFLSGWTAPAGQYQAPPFAPFDISVTVAPGARFLSNFWVALLLLMLPLLWFLVRHLSFEGARLAQRDGGGSDSDDDEDDEEDDF